MKALTLTPQQALLLRGIADQPTLIDSKNPAIPTDGGLAYATGVRDGEAQLARRLLQAVGK